MSGIGFTLDNQSEIDAWRNSPEGIAWNIANNPGYVAPVGTPVYQQVETEVSRVQNADGTWTVTFRGSTDPDSPTYTRIEGTPTPAPVVEPVVTPVVGGTGPDAAAVWEPAKDARNTINGVLKTFGLESLSEYLYNVYARQEVNIDNPDAIIYAVRDQTAYKERFAANPLRKNAGFSELDPASYIGLENQYEQIMRANNMPIGFFDQKSDFTSLIANNKSPSEVQDAVMLGFAKIDQATPEALKQFQEYYPEAGFTRESLAAWFIDPTKAVPILERQAQAALIGSKAKEQGGMFLGRLTAEELAARGYTDKQANEAFMNYSAQKGLYNPIAGEDILTQSQQVGALFGYDAGATDVLQKRKEKRVAEFQGGGQFSNSRGVTSGTVETAIGTGQ